MPRTTIKYQYIVKLNPKAITKQSLEEAVTLLGQLQKGKSIVLTNDIESIEAYPILEEEARDNWEDQL